MSESSAGEPPIAGRGAADPAGEGVRPPTREADARSASGPAPGSGDADPTPGRGPPKLVRKLQEKREAYKEYGRAYRIAWVTAGVIVVVAGLVMIVFPGPALVVIPIGLAMLSLEFAWAERLLDTTLERGIDAKDIALGASRPQKIVGIAAIVTAIAAAVAVAVLYVF